MYSFASFAKTKHLREFIDELRRIIFVDLKRLICLQLSELFNLCVQITDSRTSMSVEPGLAKLTMLNTTPNDTGRFAIELTNEYGTQRMFSSVTIEGWWGMLCSACNMCD